MLKDSIKTLAATPPPAHRTWKFKTSRSAQTESNRLESLLGLPQSPLGFNLNLANERVRELEAMLASKNAATLPAASAVAAPVVEKFGRERFNASVSADAAKKPAAQSHPGLSGRERFSADLRVDAPPQNLSGNQNPIPAGLTGRKRFAAAAKISK